MRSRAVTATLLQIQFNVYHPAQLPIIRISYSLGITARAPHRSLLALDCESLRGINC
jgi:hypothetical protein